MPPEIPLSSKLAATAAQGFALRLGRQPEGGFDWHKHDCAMLLWPREGALHSRWQAEPGMTPQALALRPRTALLLPASAAHSTWSGSARQRHGELYLHDGLLGTASRYGVFQLDGAAVAMLDALAAPALAPAVVEPLVHALLAQLATRQPVPCLAVPGGVRAALSRLLLQRYLHALDTETAMPGVETVAGELGVSMRSLQRACTSELGCSPVVLRRRLLSARARELLAHGLSTARVSQQLGFAHSGHLNRLLREMPA